MFLATAFSSCGLLFNLLQLDILIADDFATLYSFGLLIFGTVLSMGTTWTLHALSSRQRNGTCVQSMLYNVSIYDLVGFTNDPVLSRLSMSQYSLNTPDIQCV